VKILVTGVTGYIGGKLVPLLIERGHDVRVLVRDREKLPSAEWVDRVEIAEVDLGKGEGLLEVLKGVDVAYYLVHSMGSGPDFRQRDSQMAQRFATAAYEEGIARIIYLGALGDPGSGLTEHLKSRHETGRLLAGMGVQVIELRAGPVVGAGSLPFEMIRYLTERVPVMICPRWVFTLVQPIALHDVLVYLVSALQVSSEGHEVFEIGGRDVVSYGEMMTGYAKVRGLRRLMIRVPVLTPRLSSLWVRLITPLRGSFARPIVEGLRNEVVVRDDRARKRFPEIAPSDYLASVRVALHDLNPASAGKERQASSSAKLQIAKTNQSGMITERRTIRSAARPDAVFSAFSSLGGATGWYLNWGWQIRGAIDRLVGGPGLRKGRSKLVLTIGDRIDFWRVERVEPGRLLLLRAEMKLPGDAWLQFEATPDGKGGTSLTQTSFFAPKGLAGVVYWTSLLPIHKVVFNGLARRVVSLAKAGAS
jgi:uncharacterized protein YbjT (DUF2867 family)